MTREALQQALEFCEFLWRDVAMSEYAEEYRNRVEDALRAALRKPQDEPVAWMYEFWADRGHPGLAFEPQNYADNVALYTHSADQLPPIPLSDEKLGKIINENWGVGVWAMARAIEAAHGIGGGENK